MLSNIRSKMFSYYLKSYNFFIKQNYIKIIFVENIIFKFFNRCLNFNFKVDTKINILGNVIYLFIYSLLKEEDNYHIQQVFFKYYIANSEKKFCLIRSKFLHFICNCIYTKLNAK